LVRRAVFDLVEEPPSPPGATYEKPVIYSFGIAPFSPAPAMERDRVRGDGEPQLRREYMRGRLKNLVLSRCAVRAARRRNGLLGLKSQLEKGNSVAFTIDGRAAEERGQAGTGVAGGQRLADGGILRGVERRWVLNTWDAMMIPNRFQRRWCA